MTKQIKITWKNETRKIDELIPYEFNPRTITKTQVEKLKDSISSSGYNAPILIDKDNTIIAGHQRWHVLKLLKHKTVDVRVPSVKLDETQFKRINIQDNVDFGEWNTEALANFFDHETLIEWGIKEYVFGDWASDIDLSERDGAHTDGAIGGKITITCEQDDKQLIINAAKQFIEEQGLNAEVK